jgi:transglutaminase-like putative cysteine protease
MRPVAFAAACALLVTLMTPAVARAGWSKPAPVPDWVVQAAALPTTAISSEIAAGAPAVTLLEDKLVTIDARGQGVERYRQVIRILKPQGREYGNVGTYFSSDSKLLSFHAWSIGPDGHQYSVKDEDVREHGLDGYGMLYVDERYREVTPPGADPGGVVAYEYTQQMRSYVSEASWDFQGSLPAVRSVFELDLAPGWKHEPVWCRHAALAEQEVAPSHYRWELDNVERIDRRDQPLAPSEPALAGRMIVHYAATDLPHGDALWARVGDWYQNLAAPSTENRQDVTVAARALAAPDAELTVKLQSVAAFMQQKIRYVGIEIGIGGWRPHSAEDIYKNRYGDCKDKATLLISMLDALGVRATWVLVDTHRGYVDPGAPSMDGNHAIAAIELPRGYSDPAMQAIVTAKTGRRYLIFDPTNEYVPIGSLPEYLQGGYGTLVLGADSQVIALPVLAPAQNVFTRSAKFTLSEDGKLEGKVVESSLGASSGQERRELTMRSDKEQREGLEARLHRDLAAFTLSDEAAENVRRLDQPLTLTYALSAPQYAKHAGELLLVRPRVVGTVAEPFESRPRHYPVNFEAEGTWREQVSIALPSGFVVDDLPQATTLDTPFASYRSSFQQKNGELDYTREYVVKAISLPAEDYAELRKFEQQVLADEAQSAVLKRQ